MHRQYISQNSNLYIDFEAMGQILAVIFHKLTKNIYFCRFGKIMTGVKFFPVSCHRGHFESNHKSAKLRELLPSSSARNSDVYLYIAISI
jgi:hypothetical protein